MVVVTWHYWCDNGCGKLVKWIHSNRNHRGVFQCDKCSDYYRKSGEKKVEMI